MMQNILRDQLRKLRSAILAPSFSRPQAISAMDDLLGWLALEENNNDANCREVDSYVAYEIMPEEGYRVLPPDIKGIIFDMGATLHDTHSYRKIAENFEGTPIQLLERVRRLK